MRKVQRQDAEAQLSAVLDDVRRGENVVITSEGREEAVVISWAEWNRLSNVPSFARLLLSSPIEDGDIPERSDTPFRAADL